MTPIAFEIPGKPATAGSKRSIPYRKRNGAGLGVRVLHDCERFESWRGLVAYIARTAMNGGPSTEPIKLVVRHVRSCGHHGTSTVCAASRQPAR